MEVMFLVASDANNPAHVPLFSILRSTIYACLTPFLGFHQIVHGQLEASQPTLRVGLLTFIKTTQYLGLERLECCFQSTDNIICIQEFGVDVEKVVQACRIHLEGQDLSVY